LWKINETLTALQNTCSGLIEVADYSSSELGLSYVLLGKFQTDCLEARFGQYRQLLCGGHNFSQRQIIESEKKLRLPSTLKLKLKLKEMSITLTNFEQDLKEFDLSPSPGFRSGVQKPQGGGTFVNKILNACISRGSRHH